MYDAFGDPTLYTIEPIQQTDDITMAAIIRAGLKEYGADRPGFAWQDPELDRLTQAYAAEGLGYWVARDPNGGLAGGCGIGFMSGVPNCCELQKMYIRPECRGIGLGAVLLKTALDFAETHYRWCYLETLESMSAAGRLYRRAGFMALPQPLGQTGHGGCDHWYLTDLKYRPPAGLV